MKIARLPHRAVAHIIKAGPFLPDGPYWSYCGKAFYAGFVYDVETDKPYHACQICERARDLLDKMQEWSGK